MSIPIRWFVPGLALLLALCAVPARAATLGPDAFGYRACAVSSPFEDISATGTRVLDNVDDAAVAAPIGFPFGFYGAEYSNLFISSNGILTFCRGSTQVTNQNIAIASPFANVPAIAVLWDDWVTDVTVDDAVYYQTLGAPGSRRFVVQWHMVFGFGPSPQSVTFQAVLLEGSSEILLRYPDVDSGDFRSSGASATIGVRDFSGHLNGRVLQWSFDAPAIASGDALLFAAPGAGTGGRGAADLFGYRAQPATGTPFEDISGSGTRILDDVDDDAVAAPIGFRFPFYGSSYTSLFISSNALITFGAPVNNFFNQDLITGAPSADVPAIAPLWDDWVTDRNADDAVYYQTLGVPGSRRFVVQWHMVFGFGPSPQSVTFQAVLFEGNGAILFNYLDVDSGNSRAFGGSATVGIRDAGGHVSGWNLQWSFDCAVIENGQAILFDPAPSTGRAVAAGSFANRAGFLQVSAAAGASGAHAGGASFRLPPGLDLRSARIARVLVNRNSALVVGHGRLGGILVPFSILLLPAGNQFQISIGGAFPVNSGLLTLQRGTIRLFP